MARNIIITGATKGIGRALTEEFGRLGHRIIGCGRDPDAIDILNDDERIKGLFSIIDVTNREEVEAWAHATVTQFGPPSLVFNNAGIINRNALFVDVPPEEFDQVIDINIKGVANVMRAFLPSMIKHGSGIMVNLSSGWGRSVSPEVAPYCCSKWAIEGLSRAVAQEVPKGLAVIPLSPNVVDTQMLRSCFGPGAESSPDPEEWAKVSAPWLLDLGPQHNGQPLSTPI